MKRYERTTLTWEDTCLTTGLRLNGELLPTEVNRDKYVDHGTNRQLHAVTSLRAVNLPPDGGPPRGRVTFEIMPRDYCVAPNKEMIEQILNDQLERCSQPRSLVVITSKVQVPKGDSWMDTEFSILFTPRGNYGFCNAAIEVVRALIAGLHIPDTGDYSLSDFTIERETLVHFEGSWITYANSLRINHRLPVLDQELDE